MRRGGSSDLHMRTGQESRGCGVWDGFWVGENLGSGGFGELFTGSRVVEPSAPTQEIQFCGGALQEKTTRHQKEGQMRRADPGVPPEKDRPDETDTGEGERQENVCHVIQTTANRKTEDGPDHWNAPFRSPLGGLRCGFWISKPPQSFTARSHVHREVDHVEDAQPEVGLAPPESSEHTAQRAAGATWRISPPAIPAKPPTSEAQLAECSDGSLLLSMRNEARAGQRAWARWKDDKWSEPWLAVTDPTCQASLIRHPHGELLLSNPNNPKRRDHLTIRHSTDNGQTWSDGKLLDPGFSMYSCMTVLRDGRIGILYESGDTAGLVFARFPLEWVLEK